MKKVFFLTAMVTGAILVSNNEVKAQDTNTDSHTIGISVPSVALLDVEPSGTGKNITMNFTAPTEAGLPITAAGDNNALWLNYSSILTSTVTSRRVTVKIDAAIAGVTLKVTAGAASNTGAGTKGNSTSQLTLSATNQDIITGIGSVYTGDGVNNGHQLTYNVTAENANYANLVSGNHSVIVTYTLADN